MEARHEAWSKKMSSSSRGIILMDIVEVIDSKLSSGMRPADIFKEYFLRNRKLSLAEKTKVALAIAVLSANGDDFRFEWNKYYGGAGWADAMEVLGRKEIYNPVR